MVVKLFPSQTTILLQPGFPNIISVGLPQRRKGQKLSLVREQDRFITNLQKILIEKRYEMITIQNKIKFHFLSFMCFLSLISYIWYFMYMNKMVKIL